MTGVPAWLDRMPHRLILRGMVTLTFAVVLLNTYILAQPWLPTGWRVLGQSSSVQVASFAQLPLTPTPRCDHFPTQAAAQEFYRAHPMAGARLDGDHDGIACEDNLPPQDLNPVER